jgi:hypothetical protein
MIQMNRQPRQGLIPDGWSRIVRSGQISVGNYYGVFGEMVSGLAKGIPLPRQVIYVTHIVEDLRPFLRGTVWAYMGRGFDQRRYSDQVLFLDQVGIGSQVEGKLLNINYHDIGLYRPPDDINKMAKALDGSGYEDVIVENTRRIIKP